MAKKLLKEAFEWTVQKMKRVNTGEIYYLATIDPKLSQSSFQYRNEIKQYGGMWLGPQKTWGFYLPNNKEEAHKVIEDKVKPCIEFLKSVENPSSNKTADETFNEIISTFDSLIKSIDAEAKTLSSTKEVDTSFDPKDIKDKLVKFKQELIDSFNDDSWKEKMMPIIKFRRAQGPSFSLLNSILIYMQDPQATMVKSRGNWEKANRTVKPDAPALVLMLPKGQKLYKTPQQQAAVKREWLISTGKISSSATQEEVNAALANLTVGEKEILRKKLNSLNQMSNISFEFKPLWFDVRFTEQMEGTEDLVGSREDIDDIDWYDKDSPESEKSAKLFDAVLQVIEKSGVKLEYASEDELGGARGVSTSGKIKVLSNQPKTPGAVNTLVHEFAHELLHQRYLKDQDKYSDFFVGTQQGRGPVEQQAEITAWIVLRNFGYDLTTSVNYAGIWGADDKNCMQVFDTVAKVASFIIEQIYIVLNGEQVNESAGNMVNLTGADVAKMLGKDALDAYNRSKEMNSIKEGFYSMLNRLDKAGK